MGEGHGEFRAGPSSTTALKVERVVDAARRREPLQKKVGVGLSKEEYLRGVEEGRIRHIGLPESAAMLAAGMGWKLERVEEEIEPVIGDRPFRGANGAVEPGFVAGTRQVVRGFVNGPEPKIILDLKKPGQRIAVPIRRDPPRWVLPCRKGSRRCPVHRFGTSFTY
ncbi:MAG: hypothetical protein AB1523_10045 [Bacillota bacterium]